MTHYLTTEQLVKICERMLGGDPAVRDIGLLESAAARPRTTIGGLDAYETLPEKAAALLHSIVLNHPLVDGNKRLAFVAAATFLALNGLRLRDADEIENDAYRLVMDVAESTLSDVDKIGARLARLLAA